LYQEYLVCGGDWMNSTIVSANTQTSQIESCGEEKYLTFNELQKRYGTAVAKQIRAEKRRLQDALPANSQEAPFVMKHPDLPESEDLLRSMIYV